MTEHQKKILLMLADGKGYSEIARELGVTKQAVKQSAMGAVSPRRTECMDGYYYPNIVRYISKNHRSIREFSMACGINYPTILAMLRNGRRPQYRTIKRLAKYIGMSVDDTMRLNDEDD